MPPKAGRKPRAHKPRNRELARGVTRFSRTAMSRKTGAWRHTKKVTPAKKVEEKKPVVQKFGKGERVIRDLGPHGYPADDVTTPVARKSSHNPTRLRKSITPGTVLILLAGRFRGKRVVFLKQLKSGLLLITGPYKINGVPSRRVNQAYVIATTTKVPLTGVNVDAKFSDDYFKRPAAEKKKKTEAEFFAPEQKKKEIKPERGSDQKALDAPILAAIKKEPMLRQYLKARFSLKRNQYPHELKF